MDNSCETSERTSERTTLKPKNGLPLPNTTKKESGNERFKIVIPGVICCVFLILGLIIYFAVNWYVEVFEERKGIDQKITVVSEKWIDYETNEQINCTNDHTCLFNCSYIDKHFHKEPSECEYEDYYNVVRIIVEIWLILCICNCLCQKK